MESFSHSHVSGCDFAINKARFDGVFCTHGPQLNSAAPTRRLFHAYRTQDTMNVATILSSTATTHSARLYTPRQAAMGDLFEIHLYRRHCVGVFLASLLDGNPMLALPDHEAGPYSNRYREELHFLATAFGDDVAGEALYWNIKAQEEASVEKIPPMKGQHAGVKGDKE
jgi:hypothetical protein